MASGIAGRTWLVSQPVYGSGRAFHVGTPPFPSSHANPLVGHRPNQHRRQQPDDGSNGIRRRPPEAQPCVGLDNEQDTHDGGDERLVDRRQYKLPLAI